MTHYYDFINVAVALPVYGTYTYEVPAPLSALISAGKRVLVPFGNRRVTGYVLNPCKKKDGINVKKILDVLDREPLFPPAMIPFFKWIADYYIHPLGEVIQSALPGGINVSDSLNVEMTDRGLAALKHGEGTPLNQEVLSHLQSGACSLRTLSRNLNRDISGAVIQSMEKRGWISARRELSRSITNARKEPFVSLTAPENFPLSKMDRLTEKRKRMIDLIRAEGPIAVAALKSTFPSASAMVRALEAEGFVSIFHKRVYRDPFGDRIDPDRPPPLTDEQQMVVSEVAASLGRGFRSYLLAGVTGSGKTEVYMRIASESVERGFSALILVPEIALISQTERRFRARFGECVAVLHSGLSRGERFDQWQRILRREAAIVIGARSAIFAPLDNIGVIIVDEEHDASYKQESSLRYNARDLAVVRAKLNQCVSLLGSATPSIQSGYNVETQKFTQLNLKHRINKRALPEMAVVDLRKQKDIRGIGRFITPELNTAISQTLDRGEQVLLFLNRRGFASFPVCADCGEAIRCKNCDISLTLHKKINAYKCHFCGFMLPAASACPDCRSTRIKLLGFGTEKVEAAVSSLFPEARIARLDQDTTARKGAMVKILKTLRSGGIDILVGTQMVAKGHDFPNITLVGILCADLSLSFPDFRAGERTFQLLAQVAGRAGRGSRSGRVIMQTYNPDHFSIVAARNQDFNEFYAQEIRFRQALGYPPFSRLIQLKISGRDAAKTRTHARDVGELCAQMKSGQSLFAQAVDVLGPIEAALPKIAQQYRWQILLKSAHVQLLHRFVHQLIFHNKSVFNASRVKVAVDVDPISMM